MALWFTYIAIYFTNALSHVLPTRTRRYRLVGLWETAMATRETWVKVQ